jgi:hypothetical protein
VLAELFTSAVCAGVGEPPRPPVIAITNPLPPPGESVQARRILSPADGAVFIATTTDGPGGAAAAMVAVRGPDDGTWFLNGRRVDDVSLLCCTVGQHELRCVFPDGAAHRVRFKVSSGATRRVGLMAKDM